MIETLEIIEKPKFPRADAIVVAREMVIALAPFCEPSRLVIAGSLRRRKAMVGDVEVVYVPQKAPGVSGDFFAPAPWVARTDEILAEMIARGMIEKRVTKLGGTNWGPSNKYARHRPSGIPIDFFQTDEESFWNYLVCRTGGAEMNVAICNGAIARGWKWNPTSDGFSRPDGLGRQRHVVTSEREVFEFAGLDYLEPWERV